MTAVASTVDIDLALSSALGNDAARRLAKSTSTVSITRLISEWAYREAAEASTAHRARHRHPGARRSLADPVPARQAGTADMIEAVIGDIAIAIPGVSGTMHAKT